VSGLGSTRDTGGRTAGAVAGAAGKPPAAGADERAYVQWSLESYLDRLASDAPEPGGGSVAALVGALGAALLSMVANLTLGKEKYADVQEEMAELEGRAAELRAELEELVTLDAHAYGAVAAAMKLPQEGEAQKQKRKAVLQAALQGAAAVPLKIALAAVEVAKLSLPAAQKGNLYAVSDAGVAALLADAAAQAAALNVKINLAWIEDEDFKRAAWTCIEEVLAEAAHLRDLVMAITYSKL
jgi:formiminotetrahydrofolate cyclodeaminase